MPKFLPIVHSDTTEERNRYLEDRCGDDILTYAEEEFYIDQLLDKRYSTLEGCYNRESKDTSE